MRTEPDHIGEDEVVAALHRSWGVVVDSIAHAPVGFGSHHWRVRDDGGTRWFVTADDLGDPARPEDTDLVEADRHVLVAALGTARSLRDHGLAFVVAPRPSRSGAVVEPLGERAAVAVYPHVVGTVHDWGPYPTAAERLAVVGRLAELHRVAPGACPEARADDLVLDGRPALEAALDDRSGGWGPGPFAGPALALVASRAGGLRCLLERYDQLVAILTTDPGPTVITHGEPHRGNTIRTTDGVVLVDWDTTLVAPPERDLWWFATDADALAAYRDRTGSQLRADALELYRLRWDLTDVALALTSFRRPHVDDEDRRLEWTGLGETLARIA